MCLSLLLDVSSCTARNCNKWQILPVHLMWVPCRATLPREAQQKARLVVRSTTSTVAGAPCRLSAQSQFSRNSHKVTHRLPRGAQGMNQCQLFDSSFCSWGTFDSSRSELRSNCKLSADAQFLCLAANIIVAAARHDGGVGWRSPCSPPFRSAHVVEVNPTQILRWHLRCPPGCTYRRTAAAYSDVPVAASKMPKSSRQFSKLNTLHCISVRHNRRAPEYSPRPRHWVTPQALSQLATMGAAQQASKHILTAV